MTNPDEAAPKEDKLGKIQIRWLIRRDMHDVLTIERASSKHPWTEEDFLSALRQRNCIGMVAEREGRIVGHMIYELHQSKLRILNLAVAPDSRRQGVGGQMVQRLIDKLSAQRRNDLLVEVRETNLDAQLFFKNKKFNAVTTIRNFYDDTHEDTYVMQYSLEKNLGDPSNLQGHKARFTEQDFEPRRDDESRGR